MRLWLSQESEHLNLIFLFTFISPSSVKCSMPVLPAEASSATTREATTAPATTEAAASATTTATTAEAAATTAATTSTAETTTTASTAATAATETSSATATTASSTAPAGLLDLGGSRGRLGLREELLERKELLAGDVELVANLEGSSLDALGRLDGEVDLVDGTENFVDLANGSLHHS